MSGALHSMRLVLHFFVELINVSLSDFCAFQVMSVAMPIRYKLNGKAQRLLDNEVLDPFLLLL